MKNERNINLNEKIHQLKVELAWRKKLRKLKAQYNMKSKDELLTADPNELNADEQVMRGLLKQNPYLTLEELREVLDVMPKYFN